LAESLLEAMEPGLAFEADALDVLRAHDWPGNVIELREVVRRAARLSERTIGPIVMRSVLARPLPRAKHRRRKAPVVRIAVGASPDLEDARVRSRQQEEDRRAAEALAQDDLQQDQGIRPRALRPPAPAAGASSRSALRLASSGH